MEAQTETKKTLHQIVQNHTSLEQLMVESGGEITAEDQEKILDSWMLEVKSDLENKADGYQYRMKMLEQAAASLSERADKIYNAAKSCDNLSKNLKNRMKDAMLEMNLMEVNSKEFTFKLSKSAPQVQVTSLDLLPGGYTREKISIEIDKPKIKEALAGGTEVPGAMLVEGFTLKVTENNKIKGGKK